MEQNNRFSEKININDGYEINNKNKIVFFLGAGFSFDADMPIMSEFADYSHKEFMSITNHAFSRGNSFRLAAPMIYESGLYYRAFKRNFENEGKTVEAQNIEWLFQQASKKDDNSIIELNIELIDSNGTVPIKVSKEELITHLKFWTWKIYNRLPLIGGGSQFQRNPDVNIYLKFYSWIRDLYNIGNDISIITTNYDLIIEYCLWLQSIGSADKCLSSPKAYYPLTATKINLKNNTDDFLGSSENGIPVYKVHGSVNYFMRQNLDDKLYVSCDRATKNVGMTKLIGYPVAIHLDGLVGIRNEYGSDLIPEIVPPLPEKSYKDQSKPWLAQIIHSIESVLSEAEKLIFIGYSLPQTDVDMAEILKNNTSSDAKIYVINPTSSVRQNYENLYDREVEFWELGLSDALKDFSFDPV